MSFGYYDNDWIDPDDEDEELEPVYCEDCCECEQVPDKNCKWGWCHYEDMFVKLNVQEICEAYHGE